MDDVVIQYSFHTFCVSTDPLIVAQLACAVDPASVWPWGFLFQKRDHKRCRNSRKLRKYDMGFSMQFISSNTNVASQRSVLARTLASIYLQITAISSTDQHNRYMAPTTSTVRSVPWYARLMLALRKSCLVDLRIATRCRALCPCSSDDFISESFIRNSR